jgi:hypothetical protein
LRAVNGLKPVAPPGVVLSRMSGEIANAGGAGHAHGKSGQQWRDGLQPVLRASARLNASNLERLEGIGRFLRALFLENRQARTKLAHLRLQAGEVVFDGLAGDVLKTRGQLRELIGLKLVETAEWFAENVFEELFEILSHDEDSVVRKSGLRSSRR